MHVWLLQNPEIVAYFPCPICSINIDYDEIVYLGEILMLIDIMKNEISFESVECQGYLRIDHKKEYCELEWE